MYIKKDKATVFLTLIIVVIFCECNGMRLFRISDDTYRLILLIVLTFFACLLLVDKKLIRKDWGKWYVFYLVIIFCFVICEFVYTTHLYTGLSTYDFLNGMKHYMYLFSVPLLIYLFYEEGMKRTLDCVSVLVTISHLFLILHALLYNNTESGFLQMDLYTSRTLIRNGRLRIWDLSSLEGLAILWCWFSFQNSRKGRIKYFLQTVICMSALFYVEQTRMMQIAMIICLVMMMLCKKASHRVEILVKLFLVISGIYFGSMITEYYWKSIFDVGTRHLNYSSSVRLSELHFISRVVAEKGIWGIGMIPVSLQQRLFLSWNYIGLSLDDVGLIGYFALAGIWIVPIFIMPLFRYTKFVIFSWHKQQESIFCATLLVYLLITSTTLFVLDRVRFLMWPFVIAIFEYENTRINVKGDG